MLAPLSCAGRSRLRDAALLRSCLFRRGPRRLPCGGRRAAQAKRRVRVRRHVHAAAQGPPDRPSEPDQALAGWPAGCHHRVRARSLVRRGWLLDENDDCRHREGQRPHRPRAVRDPRDGVRFKAVDFNFWGVTFTSDSNRFFVTLATGGTKYLVEARVDSREGTVLRTGVECPSLSPDNTRLAYKEMIRKDGVVAAARLRSPHRPRRAAHEGRAQRRRSGGLARQRPRAVPPWRIARVRHLGLERRQLAAARHPAALRLLAGGGSLGTSHRAISRSTIARPGAATLRGRRTAVHEAPVWREPGRYRRETRHRATQPLRRLPGEAKHLAGMSEPQPRSQLPAPRPVLERFPSDDGSRCAIECERCRASAAARRFRDQS